MDCSEPRNSQPEPEYDSPRFHDDDDDMEDSEDYTSSSGSSSDEEFDEEDSDEEGGSLDKSAGVPQLTFPSSSGKTGTLQPSQLANKLKNFLPSLKAANDDLEREQEQEGSASRNLEVGEGDDGPYVDMNLGLGVLEEVKDGNEESSEDEESNSEKDPQASGDRELPVRKRKADALDDMLGRKKRPKLKPSIEVVAGKEPGKYLGTESQ